MQIKFISFFMSRQNIPLSALKSHCTAELEVGVLGKIKIDEPLPKELADQIQAFYFDLVEKKLNEARSQ